MCQYPRELSLRAQTWECPTSIAVNSLPLSIYPTTCSPSGTLTGGEVREPLLVDSSVSPSRAYSSACVSPTSRWRRNQRVLFRGGMKSGTSNRHIYLPRGPDPRRGGRQAPLPPDPEDGDEGIDILTGVEAPDSFNHKRCLDGARSGPAWRGGGQRIRRTSPMHARTGHVRAASSARMPRQAAR